MVINTREFTIHGIRWNYFLNKIILIVIKNSLFGVWTYLELFTVYEPIWNYLSKQIIILEIKRFLMLRLDASISIIKIIYIW
jgi:hypothetical protein